MEEKKPAANWWQTAPGILTAVAALMTATGGLLLALNQVGCFDKSVKKNDVNIQTPSEKNDPKQNNTESKTGTENQKTKELSSGETGIRPGKLKLPEDLNIGGVKIKFLDLTLDKYSSDKTSLKIKFRVLNEGKSYATFDYYLFRLLFDGQMLSPEKPAVGYIDSKSSKDNEVLFVFPDTTEDADLQISYTYDENSTTKIPLNLNLK